jgi:hypothetical protein
MAKTANYTDEQAAMMKARYDAVREASEDERDAVVLELAAELGKNKRSVISKLSNMGVYVPKVAVAKDGEPAQRKDELAVILADVSGIDGMTSTEKLTKPDLKKLIARFRELTGMDEDEVIED